MTVDFLQMALPPLASLQSSFSMMIFASVFQTSPALSDFWILMYRVNPMRCLDGDLAAVGMIVM